MNPYHRWIDPGGQKLARRLDQLRDTFNDLAGRLRSTIASVIANTFSNLIQDVVLQTLHGFAGASSLSERPAMSGHQDQWSAPGDADGVEDGIAWRKPINSHDDREPDAWFGGQLDDDEPEQVRFQGPTSSPPVPVIVVAAGLQAASLWLRHWTGRRKLLTTLGVGLLTGGLAYAVPALATSILNLAGSALQLAVLNTVHVPNNPLVSSLGLT